MKDDGYKIRGQHAVHFITFSVVEWVDVFTRRTYADIVIQSLLYCINNKGLKLYGWCIMSNRINLIISTANGNLSDILRDFKKFTSKEIITTIENNKQESRKNWMVWIFKKAGEKNSRNKEYQFWQQDNNPILLETVEFTLDKLNYMHNNPVKAGIVDKTEEYLLCSARDYYFGKSGLLPVEHLAAAYTLRPT